MSRALHVPLAPRFDVERIAVHFDGMSAAEAQGD